MPVSSTILFREEPPETSVTLARGTRERLGEELEDGVVRLPRSGAAATRTFQESPCRPTTPGADAPGATRSRNLVVGATTAPRIVARAD